MTTKYTKINWGHFFKNNKLKEQTAYLVNVSLFPGNPVHQAILFVGFKNSAYCMIYTNNYESPERAEMAHTLEIIKELCPLK